MLEVLGSYVRPDNCLWFSRTKCRACCFELSSVYLFEVEHI